MAAMDQESTPQPQPQPRLDRSRLKLDLKPANGRQLSINTFGHTTTEGIIVTPLSAPARSHFYVDQPKNNAVISRRGLEAWKRALAAAAPGTTMCFRNRDKSPIESLQRMWEERKREELEKNAIPAVTPKRKTVSFLLLRKPASSLRRLYQRATSSDATTTPWRIVNTAFTTGPALKIKDQMTPANNDENATRVRTTEL